MAKKMCKLVKDGYQKSDKEAFIELVKAPKVYCKKCGRVSSDSKGVCDPKKI